MGVQRIVLHENIQFGERGEGGRGWGWGGEGGNGPRERSREPISENGEFSGISCEQQPLIKYDIIPIPRRAWPSPSTSPNMAKAESGPRRPYRLVSTPEWIENIPSLSLSLSLSLCGIDSLQRITWESRAENISESWILCWFVRGESTSAKG